MKIFYHAGWIAFSLLLGAVCIVSREKIEKSLPFSRTLDLNHRIEFQCKRLATVPWEDKRPLCLFLGDSQIELGNWYKLFCGKYAVINAGVSMACVKDVASVIAQGSASKIDAVVLMCGINDLGRGEKPEKVLQDYQRLLDLIAREIRPRRTIVLSVMPVLVSGLSESKAAAVNSSVTNLNAMLASMVPSKGVEFVDLRSVVWLGRGMNPRLTSDGLHPNWDGYAVIADEVAQVLEAPSSTNSKTNSL